MENNVIHQLSNYEVLQTLTNIELVKELNDRKLIYNTPTINNIYNDLINGNDVNLGIILSRGIKEENCKCTDCKRNLPNNHFRYYYSRINKHGYLHRTNRICDECTTKRKEEYNRAFKNCKKPRPKKGDICPNCKEQWFGSWHAHHQGDFFIDWWCMLCNTSEHDHRHESINRIIT